MMHTVFFVLLSGMSITTATPNNRYGVNTGTWHQGKYIPIQARDLDQGSLLAILPRSPTDHFQARGSQGNPRSRNQGQAPRPQSAGPSNEAVGWSQDPTREHVGGPIRSSTSSQRNSLDRGNTSNQQNSPARSNAPSQRGSPARSNASDSPGPTRSQSFDEAYRSARSQSQSPVSSPSTRRTTSSSHGSPSLSRSTSSDTSSRSSGSNNFPTGPHGEVPIPYETRSPTDAVANARGPAILAMSSPYQGTEGGIVPAGHTGHIHATSPYKSKVAAFARQGVSMATARGDTASASVTTGHRSWGRLTTSTTTGHQVIYVNPNSTQKLRAETEEPGINQASATAHLFGAGRVSARGRNLPSTE